MTNAERINKKAFKAGDCKHCPIKRECRECEIKDLTCEELYEVLKADEETLEVQK